MARDHKPYSRGPRPCNLTVEWLEERQLLSGATSVASGPDHSAPVASDRSELTPVPTIDRDEGSHAGDQEPSVVGSSDSLREADNPSPASGRNIRANGRDALRLSEAAPEAGFIQVVSERPEFEDEEIEDEGADSEHNKDHDRTAPVSLVSRTAHEPTTSLTPATTNLQITPPPAEFIVARDPKSSPGVVGPGAVTTLAQARGGDAPHAATKRMEGDLVAPIAGLDTVQRRTVADPAQTKANHADVAAGTDRWIESLVAPAHAVVARLEGVLDEILSPSPQLCDMLTNIVAVDLQSLERGVQSLIDEAEGLGKEVGAVVTKLNLPTWLTVFAVSAAMCEGVRLRLRRSRGRLAFAVGPGGEPSSWLPESVGRRPEDLP